MIDVAPLVGATPGSPATDEEARVGAALDAACRDLGFFLVTGHGAPATALDELDRAARELFALPDDEKAQIAMALGGRAWRGWFPEGGELTSGVPDRKEGLYFGRELPSDDPRVLAGTPLHGPNLFPRRPESLRPAVLAWMGEMERVGHALVRGLGLGLGLGPTWFHDHLTADPTLLFRIFRYPPQDPTDAAWGVGEHTDYGLLTLLAHDGSSGLQVRTPDGGWIDVPAVDGALVVNLGDMLERMTGGRYRSTPHRVRHAVARDGVGDGVGDEVRDRLSFPFFFDPSWDAEVRPVPVVDIAGRELDDGAQRWDGRSVHQDDHHTYGEHLLAKVSKVFPHLAATEL